MRNALATALISSIIVLWGIWGFLGKVALVRKMPPLFVFVAEVAVGFAIGAVLVAFLLAQGQPLLSQRPWNLYGVLSGAALAVGLLLYYLALEHSQASVLVPVTATYPVVSVLLSVAFLSERPTMAQWGGVVLVVMGLALLLSGSITK
jgi:transporter family protein